METFPLHQVKPRTPCVSSHFENLSSDVRRYRDRDGQRTGLALRKEGATTGQALPPSFCRASHATSESADLNDGSQTQDWTRLILLHSIGKNQALAFTKRTGWSHPRVLLRILLPLFDLFRSKMVSGIKIG